MVSELTIEVFCGDCNRDTNHHVLCKRTVRSARDDPYEWSKSHYFCQCAGCNSYCYAESFWGEDDWDFISEEMDVHWQTYPKSKDQRGLMKDSYCFPPKIYSIYQEVIGAINAKLPILSAIGLRALIEAICKDRGVSAKNLEQMINGLACHDILTESQATILHGHRFLGNVAAHELEEAGPNELLAALEISENMLKTLYIIPKIYDKIKTGKR